MMEWIPHGVLKWTAVGGETETGKHRHYEVRYLGKVADVAIQYRLSVRVGNDQTVRGRVIGHYPIPDDAKREAEWRERMEAR